MVGLVEPEGKSFGEILSAVVQDLGGDPDIAKRTGALLEEVTSELRAGGTPPGAILLEALARMPQSLISGANEFMRRRGLGYEINNSRPIEGLGILNDHDDIFILAPSVTRDVIHQANATLLTLEQFTRSLRVPLGTLMGMRGVSVLVSAVMVSEVEALCADLVFSNPHQDGYPDLLPRTEECLGYCEEIRASGRWGDKGSWTDTGYGGIEVKATMGNTPTGTRLNPKPQLGEERSSLIRSFDWKAHHQETRRLLGITWDFVELIPTITAAFWRNDLTTDDWGSIISPKQGGGRTTSVSIMARNGILKMSEGWMVRTDDPSLRAALRRGRLLV